MTKYAAITDVHADVHALRDALAQIDKLGVEQILCCGDLIDYGLFPEETLTLLRDRKIIAIRGNHDRWALKDGHDMSGWDLPPSSIAYLESLPTYWRKLVNGTRIVLAHARPASDMHGIARDAPYEELEAILSEAAADVLIVGHTHVPFVRRLGSGKVVLNPGALLRDPAPGVDVSTPGTFAIVDVGLHGVLVEVRRAATGEIVLPGGVHTI
jgi:putative phosphoesterase